jgi:hypothetical protein
MTKEPNCKGFNMLECDYRNNMCPCELCIDINYGNCIKDNINKICPCELCINNTGDKIGIL